jgi:hypothetical protein
MAPKPARGLVPEPLAPERLQGGVRACWTSHLKLDANATFPLEESLGQRSLRYSRKQP